ncbi:MAG: nucleotidyltransferase family protein [Sedimentisphaerales bacterium]
MAEMTREKLLKEIKIRLAAAHNERLRGIVLYGSEVHGTTTPDSDIDLLVLLDGPVHYGRDLEINLQALHPLSLQIDRRISAKPVRACEYDNVDCPLYQDVHREGITI